MSKVDWNEAPEGAEYRANGIWWCHDKDTNLMRFYVDDNSNITRYAGFGVASISSYADYESRPKEWPPEQRIEQIGQNGATGEHYSAAQSTQSHYSQKLASAAAFLSEGLKILSERGNQYGSNQRECSFPQAAEAFNALTGHNLKGSDICLIIALVKQVRQYAQPRFHEDSAVDAVNYLALQAELLKKERE